MGIVKNSSKAFEQLIRSQMEISNFVFEDCFCGAGYIRLKIVTFGLCLFVFVDIEYKTRLMVVGDPLRTQVETTEVGYHRTRRE